jgi:hypothetical protein
LEALTLANYQMLTGDALADKRRHLRELLWELGIWPPHWPPPTAICVISQADGDSFDPDSDAQSLDTETYVLHSESSHSMVIASLPPDPAPETN